MFRVVRPHCPVTCYDFDDIFYCNFPIQFVSVVFVIDFFFDVMSQPDVL